jgi:hypothetical protein
MRLEEIKQEFYSRGGGLFDFLARQEKTAEDRPESWDAIWKAVSAVPASKRKSLLSQKLGVGDISKGFIDLNVTNMEYVPGRQLALDLATVFSPL